MLINKSSKVDVGDIMGFKLVNGDEIIAKVEELIPNGWRVSAPCTVIPSPQGLGLMQAMFSMREKSLIDLDRSHVMMMAPVDDRLQDHYNQTVTPIVVPKKGIIT